MQNFKILKFRIGNGNQLWEKSLLFWDHESERWHLEHVEELDYLYAQPGNEEEVYDVEKGDRFTLNGLLGIDYRVGNCRTVYLYTDKDLDTDFREVLGIENILKIMELDTYDQVEEFINGLDLPTSF